MKRIIKYLISLIFLFPILPYSLIILFPNSLITQSPGTLTAQPEIFGYNENEIDQLRLADLDYFFGYNKVRIDIESSFADGITFQGNINYQLFFGQNEWNLLDFLPARITNQLEMFGVEEFPFILQDTLYLDNAYVRMAFKRFDITVGKQQLSLGTGYAWNPLDIFNRKELTDPTYEQTGVNAFRIEIPLADRLMVDAIVSPGDEWESSTKLVQTKVGLGRFDFTTTVGSFQWEKTALDFMTFQPIKSRINRKMIGGAIVGEIIELGLWAEGNWNVLDGDDDFAEYLIGLDHTFDFYTYILAEYYHNGSGIENQNDITFEDYLNYFSGETHSLMQDYLFVYMNHPVTDLVNIGLFGIVNLNDESLTINPQIDYNIFENANLSLFFSRSVGDKDSEFGLQDWATRLRLRMYF